jgi:DNA-binding response OmpR family regulator
VDNIHILLVDDERGITDYLAPVLERAGYLVTVASDGLTALHKVVDICPSLIVLDVLMPGLDGRDICRQLRAKGNWTPIIMLTCVTETIDKVLSLEEGADDYLCKPFEPQELIARIRAVLRRRGSEKPGRPLSVASKLRSGDLMLNRRAKRVEKSGRLVDLTPKAFGLLEYLMLHPDQVFSREQLMDAVWGWTQPVASRAVDVRIAELRHAIDDNEQTNYIETLTGIGYRFIAIVESADE